MACVNQSSAWEMTSQTDDTPREDTVIDWLHTNRSEHAGEKHLSETDHIDRQDREAH